MTFVVERTCRDIGGSGSRDKLESLSRSLEFFREIEAYVLLGPPGSGKTTAFRHECNCQDGIYVTARDFLAFDVRPEWHDSSLYVDGLDEVRSGTAAGRTPLDDIRAKLERLGRPRFRLSCREADWFGASDKDHLRAVSPGGSITVLRLDPISDEGVVQILRAHPGIADPEGFVIAAREKGLDALLGNPQSLNMLAIAFKGNGAWPESRLQAFDIACQALLREHNQEHRIVHQGSAGISSLMNASGRLCAIQLLTGSAGFTLPGGTSGHDFPGLDRIPGEDRELLRHCLQTKLFEVLAGDRASPVHRQIAEFLAARHLASLVEGGLPAGRILALLTGHDGKVVSDLRGLAAWFAAHSMPSRAAVIARDPLGTVLYGDAGNFSPDEKQGIFDGLAQEARRNPGLIGAVQLDSRLGDLISPDMEHALSDILSDPSREDSWQSFMFILVEALEHGNPLPGLANPTMKLIRDGAWRPGIRQYALDACVRHRQNDQKALAELKQLAADVHSGRVPDPDDRLLGCLLTRLYPGTLSETEIMQFLRPSKNANSFSEYEQFWIVQLREESTRDQLALLLDELVVKYELLLADARTDRLPDFFWRLMPSALLSRFLELSGDGVDPNRLFGWLGTAGGVRQWTQFVDADQKSITYIRCWLEGHPEEQKALLILGSNRCIGLSKSADQFEFDQCMQEEERCRLFDARRPSDFGHWCLDQAVAAADRNAATWFVHAVASRLHHHSGEDGLSREVVSRRLAGNVSLGRLFGERMAELGARKSEVEARKREAHHRDRSERHDWYDHVKPHEDALRKNKGKPALLYNLAKVYFGEFIDVRGNTPADRLSNILSRDESLVEAVLIGFRRTLERNDLPTATEIIRLGIRQQTHHLARPFMAGLEEIVKTSPTGKIDLDARQLRLALAIHYTLPAYTLKSDAASWPPRWYPWLLEHCPGIVAETLVRSARSKLRNGAASSTGLHELANSEDHASVARVATLPLLKGFPVRCTDRQLSALNHLLRAARLHTEAEPLLELIDKKLSFRSMNVAQQACWLVAGLGVSPESYLARMESYAAGGERRVRFVARAVAGQYHSSRVAGTDLSVPALRLLVRLIGPSLMPNFRDSTYEGGLVTPTMNAAECVRGFIDRLASDPFQMATAALEALLSDEKLGPWRTLITDAAIRQNAVRREAEFRHCSINQILETLDSRTPANVADLAALTFEHLKEIARNIRDGNTSDWRQFWNVDCYSRPETPRPEDICRDTVLSDLRIRLTPLGIDAQPEGRCADDKRSDIRVFHGGFNVPVEIKKSCHRDLWRAIRNQLNAKYSRDPGTGGYGIYLVFWFGDTKHCRPPLPASGPPPGSARELEMHLRGTLSPDEALKTRICVVDVAIPDCKQA